MKRLTDGRALPDLDLFHERFQELLRFWGSRSTRPSSLLMEFETAYAERMKRAGGAVERPCSQPSGHVTTGA